MRTRRSFSLALGLSYFALLMIFAGPLISSAQKLLADPNQPADHEHHATLGHTPNPLYPDWVNELSMCGYCDLLALSPAVIFFTLVVLVFIPKQPASLRWFVAEVWLVILQPHAAPRAPPTFT